MQLQLPATVSPLEIVWTLIHVFGVFYASANFGDAYVDMQAVKDSARDGVLLISATGERNDQFWILLALVCWMGIGITAMFALPPRVPDGDVAWSSVAAPVLAIIGALGLIYMSYSKKIRRGRLIGILRKAPDNNPADDPKPDIPHDAINT